jgi:anti-sigma factor RsiW
VKNDTFNDHLSAEQLQALLEGDFPTGDLVRAEEHLVSCARCSAELEAWSVLFEDLGALTTPTPNEGFAERVMAGIRMPEVRHVAAGTLQDFVEGALAAREAVRVEDHLEVCTHCTTEAAAWTVVMGRLKGLESFEPEVGFADRVMRHVDIPATLPLAARVRSGVSALFGAPATHVSAEILQDLIDDVLPARAVARIQTHIDACGECAAEAEAWRNVAGRLEGLAAFTPSEAFADQVMARVRVPEPKTAVVRPAAAYRALSAAWRLIPQTREAWAAMSGVAVTPAVIAGLVFYAVFSHPTLTMGSLVSFAWWQLSDLAVLGFAAISSAAVQGAATFGIYSLFETLAGAPIVVAGGVLAYSMVCALAMRVLYRNLNPNRPNGRYAHVTAS